MEKAESRKEQTTTDKLWLNEAEVCELLGIKKTTLSQYCYDGRIPRTYYRVGIGGNKFFNREKIMGK